MYVFSARSAVGCEHDCVLAGAVVVGRPLAGRPALAALAVGLGAARRAEDRDVAELGIASRACARSGRRARAGRASSAGSIDSDGMTYGLTAYAWIARAKNSAPATSSDELELRAGPTPCAGRAPVRCHAIEGTDTARAGSPGRRTDTVART